MLMDDWIKDVKKKGGVDRDGAYGKQCVDLHNDYCDRVLGLTGKTGASYAKQLINNSYLLKHCKKIKNYLDFIPQKGDIAVWTGGTYGHVAIVRDNKSTINVLRTIDQNWVSQKLTEENHNYTYMAPLYFLRPLDQSNINPKKEEVKVEEPKVEASTENKKETIELPVEIPVENVQNEKAPIESPVESEQKTEQVENILIKIINMLLELVKKIFGK